MNRQQERVLQYLKIHKTISPMEAWSELGITKLATRISELRKQGYVFGKTRKTSENRYQEKVAYMTYSLIAEPERKVEP